MSAWEFWIDRGGTFTDLVGRRPDGSLVTTKLLSESPGQYTDAALEGMARLMGARGEQDLPLDQIAAVKMGTTVATNALLERRGEPVVLFVTQGFRDQLRIGYQNRPQLFERHIVLPELLHRKVVEVRERLGADGQILCELDEAGLKGALEEALREGYRAAAFVFLHAYRHPAHEARAAALARALGFDQVSASHEVSPLIKLVSRGDTTVLDAYLSPVLGRYVAKVAGGLTGKNRSVPLYFMQSSGGLTEARHFTGRSAVLSGPAGGVVAVVKTALQAGHRRIIGFDMGGTSTDVSHFAGSSLEDCEHSFETQVAGVRLRVPMLAVHTIAAGGGSVLHFDGRRFSVGPDSAGANPGPTCYRRGGPLTVTDCNVVLGRIDPRFFPKVFGPGASAPLDVEAARAGMRALADRVQSELGRAMSAEQAAAGFLKIAVTNMAQAIRSISVQRGHDVSEYVLCGFGGAAGQHVCAVAEELGIARVSLHPMAGVMSAYGMGLAELTTERQQALEQPVDESLGPRLESILTELVGAARATLSDQGLPASQVTVTATLHVKYTGTDTTLGVGIDPAWLGDQALLSPLQAAERSLPLPLPAAVGAAFERLHRQRFGFTMLGRPWTADSVSLRAAGALPTLTSSVSTPPGSPAPPLGLVPIYTRDGWQEAPVHERASLARAQRVQGPALLVEPHATTVVEPGWQAQIASDGSLVLEHAAPGIRSKIGDAPGSSSEPLRASTAAARGEQPTGSTGPASVDPVLLEVYGGAFMAIAEEMGVRLASTATSVNIKERLDFSCAIFDAQGELIANAPHMPVHLGSMGESVKTVIARNAGALRPGDVYALNDPYGGGTHLPDVTVVMPVFDEGSGRIAFYVAARGHHADIGGISPGSMPPASRSVEEEGVLLGNFLLVEDGRLREEALHLALTSARYPARNPAQNLADLKAQIAACEKGREELKKLTLASSLAEVTAYAAHLQDHAEECVRQTLTTLQGGTFQDTMDSGATIAVRVTIDAIARAAVVDFAGSSPEQSSNFNAPPAVVHAAVLYVFRTLVGKEIPMNAGCLRPIQVRIPEGSVLSPQPPAATVAGNVETSQVITDVLFGAVGALAASQGTMNNLTFGSDRYQYYETIAGGSGAGPGFDGTSAVQTHMTNSRMTDPEVLELRYPVRVEEHSIRAGSGGAGQFRGGDGAIRRLRFLEPMQAAILSNRRCTPPFGLAGGQPGALGKAWIERQSGAVVPLDYSQSVEVAAGDVIAIATPGGGGYGATEK